MIPLLFPAWFLLSGVLFASLFRRARIPWIHKWEEILFSATAGLGAMSLTAMGLGLMGFAGAVPFAAAAAANGVLVLLIRRRTRDGAALRAKYCRAGHPPRERGEPDLPGDARGQASGGRGAEA